MKITKSNNSGRLYFFRDSSKGWIQTLSGQRDVVSESVVSTSILGRIAVQKKKANTPNNKKQENENHIYQTVESWLVGNEYKPCTQKKNRTDDVIQKKLGYLGRHLYCTYDGKQYKLPDLLKMHYEGQDVTLQVAQYRKKFLEVVKRKQERIQKAINNNKIPFKWENKKLRIVSKRVEWLFGFLDNGSHRFDQQRLDDLWQRYQYEKLQANIANALARQKQDGNNTVPAKIASTVYSQVSQHHKELCDSLPEDCKGDACFTSFFLDNLNRYFRLHFPIKSPRNSVDSAKKKKLRRAYNRSAYLSDAKQVKRLYEQSYVKKQVEAQIRNQICANLILYGKLSYYKNKSTTTEIDSALLQTIQIEESLKKQFMTSITWGIGRLNYYYNYAGDTAPLDDEKGGGDILFEKSPITVDGQTKIDNPRLSVERCSDGTGAYYELVEKLSNDFNLFSADDYQLTVDPRKLLKEVYGTIRTLRNNVFHCRVTELFEIKNFPDYIETKICLQNDINRISHCFKEQVRSMAIADYFPQSLLASIFSAGNFHFALYGDPVSFIPSFKKIYERGCNIYESSVNHRGMGWYCKSSIGDENAHLAYKNLLQLIYTYAFIPAIAQDDDLILNHVDEVKRRSKKESLSTQKNKDQYGYANMPSVSGQSLKAYLEGLQREQSTAEKEVDEGHKTHNYHLLFVQDLFAYAFNRYLADKLRGHYQKIKAPVPQQQDAIKHTLDTLFDSQNPLLTMHHTISTQIECFWIYPLLRVLDAGELNRLLHQCIRYRATAISTAGKKEENHKKIKNIEKLIVLVRFTAPDSIFTNKKLREEMQFDMLPHFSSLLKKRFEVFIRGDIETDYPEFYYQSDRKTMILQKSMVIMNRAGVMDLYKKIFAAPTALYSISSDNYKEYQNWSTQWGPDGTQTRIEEKQKRVQSLHREIVRGSEFATESQKTDYFALVHEIAEYNDVRRKLTFESMFLLYKIHIDLLSRFVGFANDWERDMCFMLLALAEQGCLSPVGDNQIKRKDIKDMFSGGNVTEKIADTLGDGDNAALFSKLYWGEELNCKKGMMDKLSVRNDVAHLNHISQITVGEGIPPSLVELINGFRLLMAYDSKRKNSVTKTVVNVLQKHHFELALKMISGAEKEDAGKFEIASFVSQEIEHLKGKTQSVNECKISAHEQWLTDALMALLVYRSNSQ